MEFLVACPGSYNIGKGTLGDVAVALLIEVDANRDLAVLDLVAGHLSLFILLRLVPGNMACLPDRPRWLGWFSYSVFERKDGMTMC